MQYCMLLSAVKLPLMKIILAHTVTSVINKEFTHGLLFFHKCSQRMLGTQNKELLKNNEIHIPFTHSISTDVFW